MVTIRFALPCAAINRDGGIVANAGIECNEGISFMNVDRRMRIESIRQECGADIDGRLNKYRVKPRRACAATAQSSIWLAKWLHPNELAAQFDEVRNGDLSAAIALSAARQ